MKKVSGLGKNKTNDCYDQQNNRRYSPLDPVQDEKTDL